MKDVDLAGQLGESLELKWVVLKVEMKVENLAGLKVEMTVENLALM